MHIMSEKENPNDNCFGHAIHEARN